MAFQLSPGVNVTERDLTTIVPAVATTNAAFAGLFQWGPANQRILVDSTNNLISLFGLPDDNNFAYWFTAANFLGYGNSLTVARVVHPDAKNATPNFAAYGFTSNAVFVPNDTYLDVNGGSGPETSITGNSVWCAKYPGILGNSISLQLCGSATGGSANFNTWSLSGQFNSAPSQSAYALSLGGNTGAGMGDEFHLAVIDQDGEWTGTKNSILETFEGLSLFKGALAADGTSIYYKDKINNESRYIACIDVDNQNALQGLTQGFLGSTAGTLGYIVTPFSISGSVDFVSGGLYYADLDGGTGAHGASAEADVCDTDKGYGLFSDAETFDCSLILGGPAGKDSNIGGGQAASVQFIKGIADSRKDCVAFFSVPNYNANLTEQVKLSNALTMRNNIGSSSYCVIDSGYKYQYDSYNDKYRWVPLNGDIAGLCVRTDLTNDPWWSPAGFNRGQVRNVVKLAFNPTLSFRDELYKNGINPVVVFPGEGAVLYGDKTAQAKPSAFDRINVRRLFIVLEKAIATAAKYSLFEFNDSFTRAQFKSLIEPYLRDVQSRRGIIDFRVVCDERNNTPAVIDSNRFVADIYIKPNRSINFIQLNFIATRTGVSFEEVGA
jgi:hypothetical protein